MSMAIEDAAGRLTIVVWNRTLWWAVDELVEKLPPEQLNKLKVRSGEHLAAILTTTFLGTVPTEVDTIGGVDLWFDLADARRARAGRILPARTTQAAFEVRSLSGAFRKFDADINRDAARGLDPVGRSIEGQVWSANDVLLAARGRLDDARRQLVRKPHSDGTSMNVFLVVHPLDYITAECLSDYVIGPHLDPLEDVPDVDTVWVLWPPHHLAMWSRERHAWVNLMFEAMNPEEATTWRHRPNPIPVLLEAEQYFLSRSGSADQSPYFFTASYEEMGPEPS